MLTIERRVFLQSAAAAAFSTMMYPRAAWAAEEGPFTLPPLPYDFNALEPTIDAQTMELHHDKHHAAYVKNLNTAVKDHSQVAAMPLEEILATFQWPVLTRKGPVWLRVAASVYSDPVTMTDAVLRGYPVMVIIDRHVCNLLENEAITYQDGCAEATPIRAGTTGMWHSYLMIGVDAGGFAILRDTRPEYSWNGYLKVSSKIINSNFKNLKAIGINVLEMES